VYAGLRKLRPVDYWKTFGVLVTMLLVGFWHGAAWTYVIWGGLWGGIIIVHRWLQPGIANMAKSYPRLDRIMHWSGIFVTFQAWLVVGIFYVSPNLAQAVDMVGTLLTGFDYSVSTKSDAVRVLLFSLPLILVQAIQYKSRSLNILERVHGSLRLAIYILLLMLLWTNGAVELNEFLYFQF
jgi:D-alanyl-lipoteichoic acid acyltransferase DltB (MBOAT superfamily)